ncbi:MAG: ATP-binding protein, partial [Rikenellaceae bacterium]
HFNPSNFKIDDTPVVPIISDLKISGVSIFDSPTLETILPSGLYGTEGAVLNYDQNDITIKFAGINYRNSHSNRYQYQLVGFNDRFNSGVGSGSEINYTNLKPGKYTFVLKVANRNGEWSSTICQLPITINPPFWATWYAYLIFVAAIAMIGYTIIRNYHQMLKRRNLIEQAKFKHQQMADTLESRTHFFTNVSHEFRTPLTLILSPLQQLLNDEKIIENPHWSRQLKMMNYSGNTLMRLVNAFLNYSKQESGVLGAELSVGEFTTFVHRLYEQFVFWAEQRQIKLSFERDDEQINLNFDPYLMEQLILNLISNAIKYTSAGGEVAIKIENQEDSILLSVKDNGMGIPKELQSEVFKRFKSHANAASRDIGGSGVGLYLSSKLVELHNGEIWFDSSTDEQNHGTTFYVKLPKDGVDTAVKSHEQRSIIETTPSVNIDLPDENQEELPSLLIVEDNIELRSLLKELFSDSYNIAEASDGEQGLDYAINNLPDIILTDVMMPKMDGLELCRRVKSNEVSHIPVVILSAKSSSKDIAAGLRLSADAYCPKPFDNLVLIETVNSTLNNRRQLASIYLRMGAFTQESCDTNQISNVDAQFLEKLHEYIKENMHNSEFIVNDVCEYMGMSRLVLNKKLKALTNITAVVLIRRLRLQRAAELLRTSRYNVSDVTFDVGFNDLKYFREIFKKEYGVLPQEYKEQHCSVESD